MKSKIGRFNDICERCFKDILCLDFRLRVIWRAC